LAARGDAVAASARTIADLETLADEAGADRVKTYPLDVTDAEAVMATVDAIERDLGGIDVAVLNAGTYVPTPARSFELSTVRTLVETNLMGVAHGLAAILPRFLSRRRGHVVVVASVAGYCGLPPASAYGATKAALINLCEALKPELDAAGVRLTLVNPGFIKTPLTDLNDFPMPFLMEVDAAAERLVRGLDSSRFEITFPRRFTWAMKVLRCLPYGLFFLLTRRLVRA
jgi:NAD(P)-dependent dehydrogenase (short-subunit alcohol dehydrogenase family)